MNKVLEIQESTNKVCEDHEKTSTGIDEALDKLEESKNSNLYVISPEANFSFEKSTKYLSDVFANNKEVSIQYEDEE